MGYRREGEPSPLRTGIVHAGASLCVFGALAAALGTGIQITGDPAQAGPQETFALFETSTEPRPMLKARLKTETVLSPAAGAALSAPLTTETTETATTGETADLGVDYAEADTSNMQIVRIEQGSAQETQRGIRINGKLVKPGQSLLEVTEVTSLEKAPISGMHETINGKRLPRISPDGRAPADVYARPFQNVSGQPTVALIVGGLGINATHTNSAINELPPEVTLSFAPDARGLQRWINRARAAGHEVMIEVPMEAYDYGRMKMHPQTLRTDLSVEANIDRLETVLAKAQGYFGVINYQGAKFSKDDATVRPILKALSRRGVALVEDGSLQNGLFDEIAGQVQLRYVGAVQPVDTKLTANDITAQLMELETLARENGAAMGSGYAFPITIEMAKVWTASLDKKGITLAPVSAFAATLPLDVVETPASMLPASALEPDDVPAPTIQTGSLSDGRVDTAG